MKLPGEAQLDFEIEPTRGDEQRCLLTQTARLRLDSLVEARFSFPELNTGSLQATVRELVGDERHSGAGAG